MIKRETLTRLVYETTQDAGGGYSEANIEEKEIVPANVSISSTMEQITAYGKRSLDVINVATDIPLDEHSNVRYRWNTKHYRLLSQIKRGNEWFGSLMQVNE